MNEELKHLHEFMVANKLTPLDFGAFEAKVSTDEGRNKLFYFLSQSGKTNQTQEEFNDLYFKKKSPSGASPAGAGTSGQSGTSSAPSAAPAQSAGTPSIPTTTSPESLEVAPAVQDNSQEPKIMPSAIDESRLALSGAEDPIAYGEAKRVNDPGYAYKKKYAGMSDVRKGVRDIQNVGAYGEDAAMQLGLAKDQMRAKFGEGWEDKIASIATELNTMTQAANNGGQIDRSRYQDLADQYKQISEDPFFNMYLGANEALQKGQAKFIELTAKPGAIQEVRQAAKDAQAQVDQDYKDSSWKPVANFAMRKTGQVMGGLLSLPRTIKGMAKFNNNEWGFADTIGSWGDEITESAEMTYPKPSELQPGVFQKVVPFEGKKVLVVDGKPAQIVGDDGKVVAVPEDFGQRFENAGAAKQAKMEFSGAAPLVDKVASAAVDLMLMATAGGGTKLGTMAASAFLGHQAAYQEALADQKMSPDDAAEYALVTSLIQGGIESYVGNLETAIGRPALATAKALGKKEALALAGKATATQRAWARLKPILNEVKEENKEEFMQALSGDFTKAAYNDMTGSKMDMETTRQSLMDTFAVTSLLTAPMAAVGAGGHVAATRRSALMAAVNNPESAAKVYSELAEAGTISAKTAQATTESIQKLAAYNQNLPDGLTFDDRSQVLGIQEWRDRNQAVVDNEAVIPAQKAAAKANVKAADEMITGLLAKVKTAAPPEHIAPPPPEPAADGTPAEVEPPPPVATQDTTMSPPIEEPTVKEDLTVEPSGNSEQLPPVKVAGMAEGPINLSDEFTTVLDVAVNASSSDPDTSKDMFDQAVETTVSMLESRGYDVSAKDRQNIETKVSNEVFNRAGHRNPDEPAVRALDRIANEYASENMTRTPGVTLQDDIEDLFASGTKLDADDRVPGTSALYYEDGGVPLRALAHQVAKKEGITVEEAEKEIKRAMKAAPDMDFRAARTARVPAEVQNMAADLPLNAQDIEEASFLADRFQSEVQSAPDAERAAMRAFEAANDHNPAAIIATLQGGGDAESLNEFKLNAPTIYAATQRAFGSPIESSPDQLHEEQSRPEAGGESDDQRIEGPENADTSRKQSSLLPDASQVQTVDAAHEILEIPPVAETVSKPTPAAIGAAAQAGVTDSPYTATAEDLEGMPEAMDAQSEEVADVAEKAEIQAESDMQREGSETLPQPIFHETETEFIVSGAVGARDALRAAGGKWMPGRGWVFPIKKKQAAINAASTPRSPSETTKRSWGGNSAVTLAIRKPFAYKAERRRARRIQNARSTEERLAIVAEELGLKDGARMTRMADVAEVLEKAFPNIQIEFVSGTQDSRIENGKVFINLDKGGIDTLLHEYGHIWALATKQDAPELYAHGLSIMKGSEYEAAVRADPRYSNLNDEEILEEALALAIGERGARIMNAGRWHRFMEFLADMKAMLGRTFSGHPLEMSAARYADTVAREMLAGGVATPQSTREIAQVQGDKARFMFVGEDAEFAAEQRRSLNVAAAMEERGYDEGDIWRATNWHRGADGKWRFEVSDAGAALTVTPSLLEDGEVMTLGEVIDHQSLYALYPDMKTMPVVFVHDLPGEAMIRKVGDGWYMAVKLGVKDPTLPILHEMQHVVQLQAGFGVGTSMAAAPEAIKEEIKRRVEEGKEGYEAKREISDLVTNLSMKREEMYRSFAGEVEARNVTTRAQMANQDLVPPSETEDVSRASQIVVFGGKEMASDPDGEMIRSSAMEAAARQIIGVSVQENRSASEVVPKIAERMGLDERFVQWIWNDTVARSESGENVFDLREGKWTTANKRIMLRVKKATVRWFSYKGLLPKDIFAANQAREGRINGILYQIDRRTQQLEAAMLAEFTPDGIIGKVQKVRGRVIVPEDFRQLVDAALKGEANLDTLPVDVAAAVKAMRATVDTLSREMLRAGALGRPLILKIMNGLSIEVSDPDTNPTVTALSVPAYERTDEQTDLVDQFMKDHQQGFGTYLNRSYRVHDYPDWMDRVPQDAMNAARRYFVNKLKGEADEIETNLLEFEDDYEAKKAYYNGRITDAVDMAQRQLDDARTAEGKARTANTKAKAKAEVEKREAVKAEIANMIGDDMSEVEEIESDLDGDDVAFVQAVRQVRAAQRALEELERRADSVRVLARERLDMKYNQLSNIDGEIAAFLNDQAPASMFPSGAMMGAKNESVFKARKDIPEELRALMGEYKDPTINFAKTAYKMANLIANTEFLQKMLTRYEGVYFFKEGAARPAGFNTLIGSENSRSMSPLNGYRTSEDIAQAMSDYYERQNEAQWQKWWMSYVVQTVKLGKTILSPVTQARNFWGNTSFWIANGWNPLRMAGEAKQWYQRNGDKGAWYESNKSSHEWEAKIREYHELGILGESVTAGEMKAMFRDIDEHTSEEALDMLNKGTLGVSSAVVKGIKGVGKGFKAAYEMGDGFYRIMGFENEKSRYAKAWFGKSFDELSSEQKKEVSEKAALIIKAVMPTYSYVPKIARFLRRFPFTGTFVAFPAEMVRVTYNLAELAASEMKDPRTRSIGMIRSLGLTAAVTGTYLLGALAASKFGYDDDEWDSLLKFVEPFKQNAQLIPLAKGKDGEARYVNLSYTDPFSWVKKPLAAFDRSPSGVAGATIDGMSELLQPFLSWELTFKTVMQVAMNNDDRGEPIWLSSLREETTDLPFLHPENIRRIGRFTAKRIQPGIIKSAWDAHDIITNTPNSSGKIQNAEDYLMSHAFGAQVETIDPMVQAGYQLRSLGDEIRGVRSIVTSEQAKMNRAWTTAHRDEGVDAGVMQERESKLDERAHERVMSAYSIAQTAYTRILRDAGRKADALRKLGKSNEEVAKLLKDANFGTKNGEIQAILAGRTDLALKFEKKDRY